MAATGQGYRLNLFIGPNPTDYIDFENCDVSVDAEEVDTTSSLVVDEQTGEVYGVNGATSLELLTDADAGAFTDRCGGPQTLTINFSGTIRNPYVLSFFAIYMPADKIFDPYEIRYNGLVVYEGSGLYIRNLRIGAVIRGAAAVTFSMVSIQYGFRVNSALLLE